MCQCSYRVLPYSVDTNDMLLRMLQEIVPVELIYENNHLFLAFDQVYIIFQNA